MQARRRPRGGLQQRAPAPRESRCYVDRATSAQKAAEVELPKVCQRPGVSCFKTPAVDCDALVCVRSTSRSDTSRAWPPAQPPKTGCDVQLPSVRHMTVICVVYIEEIAFSKNNQIRWLYSFHLQVEDLLERGGHMLTTRTIQSNHLQERREGATVLVPAPLPSACDGECNRSESSISQQHRARAAAACGAPRSCCS